MDEDEVISEPVQFALLDQLIENDTFSGQNLEGTGQLVLEVKTTGRTKCSETTVVTLPPFPLKDTYWQEEQPPKGRTESDIRAFRKRVAKRRAKKRNRK